MLTTNVPEIQRTNLASTVLSLKVEITVLLEWAGGAVQFYGLSEWISVLWILLNTSVTLWNPSLWVQGKWLW